jgi:nitric oxide reductase NorQ protein
METPPKTGSDQKGVIQPRPMRGFVKTDRVEALTSRALNYVRAGFPVHFRGPTGAGKTTLALHIAHKLKQPVVLIHGDDQFTTADLVGKKDGYRYSKVVDEFVRGVSKTNESMHHNWLENRLTTAVRYGYTLLYDEFTRSRPEANNILLSVLQEGILDLPTGGTSGEQFIKVHPKFCALFTSNPEEYAGVHKTQDALLDRMVTLDIGHYDFDTETKIIAAKSNLEENEAQRIVHIARALRASGDFGHLPTIRGCIMVAKAAKRHKQAEILRDSKMFRQICHDVFIAEIARNENRKEREKIEKVLIKAIDKHARKTGLLSSLF